ncbi:hypothetical protein [Phycicoccus sp.]|uniref:P-loop ATPase, Sll1717 family n=1 Tax=Phycicoccus sp. TaxID=1902410 RepID=UPI002BE469BE|nr:hypothetical protein [Phycicoccus sp.]HMM94483.1 hypothetical protein [Phycicoccus sp.]
MAKRPRIRTGFTLGGEQAEADPLAEEAFVETPLYEVVADQRDMRCFVIGRTGAGKSATLQHLEEVNSEHVIRISPEDLSLPYITDLDVIRYLDSLDVKLDLFWIALWKHVLLVELLKHRYGVNSPDAKQRFMSTLREKFVREPAKAAALEYLEEFEGRFWCDTDERVRQITDKFTERIGESAFVKAGAGPLSANVGGRADKEGSVETRRELADRFQRIVNETQLAKLNKMFSILDDEILDDVHFTYVLVDDLDRDWVDERVANDLIRCLFRTVLDMQRVRNLKVLVALRTNIFQELDFGDRTGGQEEKFRALVLQVEWSRASLIELLDARVAISGHRGGLEVDTVSSLLPHANRARGNPVDYVLDRTLLRPRDAIAFLNECLLKGVGKSRLTWEDIQGAEREYSSKRLLALRDEWKPTYPGIDRVFEKFRGAPARMTKREFQDRLDECMLLLSDPGFPGVRWMSAMTATMWESGPDASWFSMYQPLASTLYRLGVIGCAQRPSAAPTFYGQDRLLMDSEAALLRTEHFHVHRMLHKALDIRLAAEGHPLT